MPVTYGQDFSMPKREPLHSFLQGNPSQYISVGTNNSNLREAVGLSMNQAFVKLQGVATGDGIHVHAIQNP